MPPKASRPAAALARPKQRATGKAARYQMASEPKLVEDTKMTLLLKGTRAGPLSGQFLVGLVSHAHGTLSSRTELRTRAHTDGVLVHITLVCAQHQMQSPHAKMLNRKNPNALPFDDASSIEFLLEKNHCGLFAVASHSKKRPDNIVMVRSCAHLRNVARARPDLADLDMFRVRCVVAQGRSFDGHILDMVEFHVEELKSVKEVSTASKRYASKPCLLFLGEPWETGPVFRPMRSLLLDFFRGDDVNSVQLSGLDHVIVCAAIDGKLHILPHAVQFRRSGTEVPRVHLEPMGPAVVMAIRRSQFPAPDLWALACKQPKEVVTKKVKNVNLNEFGDRIGQIHVQRQELDEMQLRKRKAFKTRPADDDAADIKSSPRHEPAKRRRGAAATE